MKLNRRPPRPANGLLSFIDAKDPAQVEIANYILRFRQRQQADVQRKIVAIANRKAVGTK